LNLPDKAFFCIAVTVYGIGMMYSFFLWRKGFRRDDWVVYSLLGCGLIFHTIAMVQRGFSINQCPINNLYEAIVFIMWTIVAGFLVVGLWARLRFLGAFASPLLFLMGVFALMNFQSLPNMESVNVEEKNFSVALGSLHKTLLLLSFGAFGLSAVAAAMFLTQQHDLKSHRFRAILSMLPPLQRLEQTMTRLICVGFGMLTLGLVASSAYHFQPGTTLSAGDPMVIWMLGVWVFYSVLLFLHWRQAQSGKRFAWGALGSFLFMMLTFWGAMLSHLQRTT
jgi:ABC-type uncharacterized transport system permease subunit